MKKQTKQAVLDAMVPLLRNRNAFLSTEAARIILAVEGVPVSQGVTAQQANGKITAQLTLARERVAETFQRKRERRQRQNRRQYIKKRIKVLQEQELQADQGEIRKLEAELEGTTKPANLVQAKRSEVDDIQTMLDYCKLPPKPAEPLKPAKRGPDYLDFSRYAVTATERDAFTTALRSARNNAPRDVFGAFADDNPDIWPKRESDLGKWVTEKRQKELEQQRDNDKHNK